MGLDSGEQARIKGTSDTHARADQLIGAWITVSIKALQANAKKQSKILYAFN